MIIECPNCNKKFNLEGKLIPENGRTLKCGNCAHVWHYKITLNKKNDDQKISEDKNFEIDINTSKKDNQITEKVNDENISDIEVKKEIISEIKANDSKTEKNDKRLDYEKSIKLKMIFIYIVILIISLLGLIFLLDTLKYNLSNVFPGIVPLFDSLYETLLDLKLFFKDLVK